jgi:hypothetical protein
MQWLARQIMHDRSRAILVILALALLAMMLPPVGILSSAGIALVALRQGLREAMLVAVIGLLALFAFGFLLFGSGSGLLLAGVILWIPAVMLGATLSWSRSLGLTVQMALALVATLFALQYVLWADPVRYWADLLEPFLVELNQTGALDALGPPSEAGPVIGTLLPVLLAVGFFLQLVIAIVLARWWQAALYNPGGLRGEFHALRLGRMLGLLSLPLIAASLLGAGVLVSALSLLVVSAFAIQGLAVVHALLYRMEATKWLIGVYLLLIFAGPYMLLLLGFTGLADVWLDIRQRQSNKDV